MPDPASSPTSPSTSLPAQVPANVAIQSLQQLYFEFTGRILPTDNAVTLIAHVLSKAPVEEVGEQRRNEIG